MRRIVCATSSTVAVDMSRPIIGISAEKVFLNLGNFVAVQGSFAFETGDTQTVTLGVSGLTPADESDFETAATTSVLTYAVARVYDRYRGRDWHTALENGLAPVAVGLIFAGAISILRLSGDRPVAWIAAMASGAALWMWPKAHPFLILFAGAALFVALSFAGFGG